MSPVTHIATADADALLLVLLMLLSPTSVAHFVAHCRYCDYVTVRDDYDVAVKHDDSFL
jgi:hypothetical protein